MFMIAIACGYISLAEQCYIEEVSDYGMKWHISVTNVFCGVEYAGQLAGPWHAIEKCWNIYVTDPENVISLSHNDIQSLLNTNNLIFIRIVWSPNRLYSSDMIEYETYPDGQIINDEYVSTSSDSKVVSTDSRKTAKRLASDSADPQAMHDSRWKELLGDTFWQQDQGFGGWSHLKRNGEIWISFGAPCLFEPGAGYNWRVEGGELIMDWDSSHSSHMVLSNSSASELQGYYHYRNMTHHSFTDSPMTMRRISNDEDQKRFRIIIVPNISIRKMIDSKNATEQDVRWPLIVLCSGLAHPFGDAKIKEHANFTLRCLNHDPNIKLNLPTNVGFLDGNVYIGRIIDLVGSADRITFSKPTGCRVYHYGEVEIYTDQITGRIILVMIPIQWAVEGMYSKAEKEMNAYIDVVTKEK